MGRSGLKIVATIEARMGSTRLPGKVLLPAAGKPLLEHLVERLRRVPRLDGIVMATTVQSRDDPIVRLSKQIGIGFFRGSEDDVLGRVLGAARASYADVIVEITSDCPLIDPKIVELCIERYCGLEADFVANFLKPSYPIGMAAQVFATNILDQVAKTTQEPVNREHPSIYIYRHPEKYRLMNVSAPPEHTRPKLRLTLDTIEDYQVIRSIFEALYPQKETFDLTDTINYLDAHPDIASINADVKQKVPSW